MSDYQRIEKAITYLVKHANAQPSLDEVATHIGLSAFHFQRLFCQWAGITPKRFLQVLTLEHGKQRLEKSYSKQPDSLLAIAHDIGLSGSSRLYDHFVQLEAVTPGEYKQKGAGLGIDYGVHATPFGTLFIAVTQRGICRASFIEVSGLQQELTVLQTLWPLAIFQHNELVTGLVVDQLFNRRPISPDKPLSLYVSGTNFQVAVWRALLDIPYGALVSYSALAQTLGCPSASRAVANAIGANPVALIIPCHRVIRQSGALGGYRWGVDKKQVIQTWEQL